MAVNLSPVGGVAGQFFDNNGNPLTGGKLYTYAAGTTTPQATYTSAAGVIAHSNPIILNAGGRVPNEIWLTDGLEYKFALYDANNVLIGTWDDIIGINSNFVNFVSSEEVQIATAGQTVFTLTTMQYQPGTNNLVVYVDGVNQVEGGSYSYVETNSTTVTFTSGLHVGAVVKFVSAEVLSTNVTDASTTVYTPPGSGVVSTNVQAKLREIVSLKDFGAVGDGVTDDTAAVAAAEASLFDRIYVPPGKYLTTYNNTNNLTKVYYGDGQLIIGTYATARLYSNVDVELPDIPYNQFEALNDQNIPLTSFHTVGANINPSPLPTTYTNYTQYVKELGYMQYSGGFNTDPGDHQNGRSGARHRMDFVYHNGQGDLTNRGFFGLVQTNLSGATHFLANPALAVENGNVGADSGAAGAYLQHSEYVFTDGGVGVACIGSVRNYIRTNNDASIGQVWIHDRPQSGGTQQIDCVYSVSGLVRVGLDFTPATLDANNTAIAMQNGHRIYLNASSTPDTINAKWYADQLGDVYIGGFNGYFNVVFNNNPILQVSKDDILSSAPNGLTLLSTGLLRFSGTGQYGTGSSTATFTATNKPGGTSGAGPANWLKVALGGVAYYIPCWAE